MIAAATAPLPSRLGSVVARVISAISITIAVAWGQDPLSVLHTTAGRYKAARSYSIEGTDAVEHMAPGDQRVGTRRFLARRLDSGMRVDFADGGIRLTDGKYEWNY